MCRIVLMWGEVANMFPDIFKSFSDVATEDPLLSKVDGQARGHKDGWGFLNLNKEKIVFSKSFSRLTRDTGTPSVFNGVVMMHARLAAPNEGMGVLNNHPFHVADERYDVYIVHNGWFDKYKINESLGFDRPELINDTEIFIDFVMSQEGNISTRLSRALDISKKEGYINGGANIFVVAVDRETLKISIFYHADVATGKEFKEYNKLYTAGDQNWKGVFSSSIIYSKFFPKSLEPKEIERGKLYEVGF
ncbi:MAG: hypothetical protein ACP5UZ_06770 [Thermoplasmata archaeon]